MTMWTNRAKLTLGGIGLFAWAAVMFWLTMIPPFPVHP